jgi:alpha-N-arabinofuranosidase
VRELDLATMSLVGDEHVVWHGAVEGAVWAEGPHLYRHGDEVHAAWRARAAPSGTTRECRAWPEPDRTLHCGSKANPLLTHRHLGGDVSVANVGHADLVDDGRGGWWATVLATPATARSAAEPAPTRCRAARAGSFPVAFEDGWPVFAPGSGRLAEEVAVPWAGGVARPPRDRWSTTSTGRRCIPELLQVRTAPGAPRAFLGERRGTCASSPCPRGLREPVRARLHRGSVSSRPAATLATSVEIPDARRRDCSRGWPCVSPTTAS